MPRMFSRSSRKGLDEEMTISGFSMGTSSVSDRIMGRMRMSLSGISGRNLTSAKEDESLDSGSNSGGKSSRRSLRSRAGFARRRRSSSVGKLSMPMPGMESTNVRSASGSSNNVTDGMMAEMDSTETMALTGRSMGRRAPSAPPLRSSLARAPSAPALRNTSAVDDRFGSPRRALLSRNKSSQSSRRLEAAGGLDPPPIECSLAQLRQMSELELERTLDKAGVSPEEADRAIDEVAAVDTSIATIAEDQRKNALVMLLINSGKVKLVRADKARQDSTRTLQTSNHSIADSTNRDSMYDGTDASISSIPYNDETVASVRSELSVASSTRQERRKSKLDKIFELQTENSNVKRENKSLKKTVKKLLEQLTNMTQKEKEATALAEKYKQEIESGAAQLKDEEVEENKEPDASAADMNNNDDVSKTVSRRDSDVSVDKIKQKLKAEKHAHQSTEFRLKAEIDLLTREVEGLQKQLAQTLRSIEKKEQSAKDNREATSKLKRKLNHASSTISKLKNEAEARDNLIESFTKILLQKIGAEEEENGGLDESTVGTKRMDLDTLEQSLKMSLAQDTKG